MTPPSPPGSPWPMPQGLEPASDLFTFDANTFSFSTNLENCDVIQAAMDRYAEWMFLDPEAVPAVDLEMVTGMRIEVTGQEGCAADLYPYDGMNESYELSISDDDGGTTAVLSTNTVWGALRGLETFSQLIYLNDQKQNLLNKTLVTDSPRFGYRGLMIDTGRHFLPVPVIEDIIEAMSWDKLNVLHWHIVDDQSFPYESTTFPQLSEYGAYTKSHVYSREDVSHVIEFARLRGVRVIPEFDSPGHTYSWGRGLPDLITPCWGDGEEGGPYVPKYGEHADMETVNPSQEYSYDVMEEFWAEVTHVFPDEFVHIGLDEAYYSCWQSNPNMSAWMAEMGFTRYSEVEEYYSLRLTDIVLGLNASVIAWQDPIENNVTLDKTHTRIGVWKDTSENEAHGPWQEYMALVTQKGYSTYLLGPWYLSVISYGQDWRNYYMVEPYNFTEDASLHEQVLGGSACAWGEYIDGSNILDTLWPRVSAVAERLWSDQGVTDVDEAAYRLDQHRCRIIRRGIPAKPLMPGHCGDTEWGEEHYDRRGVL